MHLCLGFHEGRQIRIEADGYKSGGLEGSNSFVGGFRVLETNCTRVTKLDVPPFRS